MNYLLSFVCIAVVGSIIAALAPKGGNEKAVKMVSGFVLAFAVISIIIEASDSIDWKAFELQDEGGKVSETELARQTSLGLNIALESEIKSSVKDFCGKEPDNVKCEINYQDGEFSVAMIKIYMEKTEKAPLFLYLSNRLGLDYGIFELYEMS